MPRIAARVLMVCLLLFPAAAFADVYQLNGPPDISIQGMTVQGNTGYATLSGASSTGGATVGTLIDAPGTGCYSAPCSLGFVVPYAVMTADQNGFVIYDDYNPPGSATPGIFLTRVWWLAVM